MPVQMQFTSVAADSVHAPMRIILLRKNCFWQLIMRIFMGEKEYTPAVVSFSGKTLDVTKTSLTIKKGKKATIKATAMPKTKITYQSKNKKVATVNSKGVVRGIRKGKTTILVTANGKTVKVQITVK